MFHFGTRPELPVLLPRTIAFTLKSVRRIVFFFVFLLLALPGLSSAGLVSTGTSPAETVLTGLQVSDLELEYFGFDPSAFFFFTGNTGYLGHGEYEIEIIAAALNPAGATSLEGVVTHEVTFLIDSSGDVMSVSGLPNGVQQPAAAEAPSAPEPAPAALLAGGIGVCLAVRRRRRSTRAITNPT